MSNALVAWVLSSTDPVMSSWPRARLRLVLSHEIGVFAGNEGRIANRLDMAGVLAVEEPADSSV